MLTLFFVTCVETGSAQTLVDSVIVQPTGKVGRVELKGGKILEYTADWLYYQPTVGKETQRIEAEEVIAVSTPRVEAHERALQYVSEHRFVEVQAEAEAALNVEKRAWVRREILGLLVQALVAQSKYESAGDVFGALIQSQPRTRFKSRVPLAWAPIVLDEGLKTRAVQWMGSDHPWTRLMGASFLLIDPVHGASARDSMETLSSNSDRQLSQLAVHDMDEQLSARAMLEAADALVSSGQKRAAVRLYQEVAGRFAHTSFAVDASASLQDVR